MIQKFTDIFEIAELRRDIASIREAMDVKNFELTRHFEAKIASLIKRAMYRIEDLDDWHAGSHSAHFTIGPAVNPLQQHIGGDGLNLER